MWKNIPNTVTFNHSHWRHSHQYAHFAHNFLPNTRVFASDYDALPPKTNIEASQNYVPLSYILKYQSTANVHTVNEIKEETSLMVKQNAARLNPNRTRIPMQNYAQNRKRFTVFFFVIVISILFFRILPHWKWAVRIGKQQRFNNCWWVSECSIAA